MNPLKTYLVTFFSILLLMFSLAADAQSKGSIIGTVIDKSTGETLPGASVFIEGTTLGTMTDLDGKFRLGNLDAGN